MTTPVSADGEPAGSIAESVFIQLVRLLPRNAFSRMVGRLSDIRIPEVWRNQVFGTFAQYVGANLDETELPMRSHSTLNSFFTRRLRPGIRPIDATFRGLVSPVDGAIAQFGPIADGRMVQAKGRTFALQDLLEDPRDADAFVGGHYITIYLSPKDYHRIHFPAPGRLLGYRYHPGHLFPVNGAAVRNIDNLFCVNERVTVFLDAFSDPGVGANQWMGTPVAVVLVGATNVGRITLSFDDLVTNRPGARSQRTHYHDPRSADRGAELGVFNLGSTVIVLVGGGGFNFDSNICCGPIKLGQRLGVSAPPSPQEG